MFEKDKRILLIAESPEKSRTITKIFKEAGYDKVIVMATIGHFAKIADGSGYWNTGIDIENRFTPDFKLDKTKSDTIKKLKDQVKAADFVYICSDADREGEAIAWEVEKFLGLKKGKYARAAYHEITKKAIFEALENAHDLDRNMIAAAHARNCLDKGLGYRLSPIAKASLNCRSVGRCQSAGLKILADREREIQSFDPETYYEIFLNFEKENKYQAKYQGTDTKPESKLTDIAAANKVLEDCKQHDFILKTIEHKEHKENPKPPFDTAAFQQEATSKLGLSTKQAMSCAQQLFEAGHISYHRTDDSTMSPEFAATLKDFVIDTFGQKYYTSVRVSKKQENSQAGHECLRVLDLNLTPEIFAGKAKSEVLAKVYRLIYNRTVASSMSAAVVSETIYHIYNDKHHFTMNSSELVFDGYRKIYTYQDKEVAVKADLVEGEILQKCELEIQEKQTKPKPRFKEASFLKELQAQGIGRPSTYASIVETILSDTRGYCKLEEKEMVPTQKGMELSAFLDEKFPDLINVNYTREMEESLDLISEGKLKYEDFLKSFFDKMEESAGKIISADGKLNAVCPNCGKPLVIKRGRYGIFTACSGYPDCKYIPSKK